MDAGRHWSPDAPHYRRKQWWADCFERDAQNFDLHTWYQVPADLIAGYKELMLF